MIRRFVGLLVVGWWMLGCSAPLRSYGPMSSSAAMEIVANRLESVKLVEAECRIVMTDTHDHTVSFDGAVVLEPGGRARLRAWKFGTAVFDLTILRDGAWLMISDEAKRRGGGLDPSKAPRVALRGAMDVLSPDFFRHATPMPSEASGVMRVRGNAFGLDDVICDVDERTLTPRRFAVRGDAGGTLTMSRYAMRDRPDGEAVAWPGRIEFVGPPGRVVITFDSIDFGGTGSPAAFTPPVRAERIP